MMGTADNEKLGPNGFVQIKEIKLQLPLRTHVNLHSMKLLRNQSIRESVVEALERYFEAHPLEPIGAPIPIDAE
jgi:hypothetical protein